MADVKQESGVKQIIVTIPVSADDGGGNIEMTLEDFCKLDISQTTTARLQEQTQSDSQVSSYNSTNVIYPSQVVMGGGGGHGRGGR